MSGDMLDISNKLHIFSGTSHKILAKKIADHIGEELSDSFVSQFNNGEIQVIIGENVRGKDIFIVETLCEPIHETLMELLVMIDSLKRASARSITAVIPYLAYSRQAFKIHHRDPIAAKLVVNLIRAAGADRIVTVDLHSGQIEGFLDIPIENISAIPFVSEYLKEHIKKYKEDIAVVSPDMSGVTRARKLAKKINAPLVILDRRRPKKDTAVVVDIVGDVKDKSAIIVDDIIDTSSSIVEGAKALKDAVAKDIYVFATHAVFSGNALEQVELSKEIKKIIVTDTLPLKRKSEKIKVFSIADILGEVVIRLFTDSSVHKLFT